VSRVAANATASARVRGRSRWGRDDSRDRTVTYYKMIYQQVGLYIYYIVNVRVTFVCRSGCYNIMHIDIGGISVYIVIIIIIIYVGRNVVIVVVNTTHTHTHVAAVF